MSRVERFDAPGGREHVPLDDLSIQAERNLTDFREQTLAADVTRLKALVLLRLEAIDDLMGGISVSVLGSPVSVLYTLAGALHSGLKEVYQETQGLKLHLALLEALIDDLHEIEQDAEEQS